MLTKGSVSPYDSAVAIHLPEYRKIRTKVFLADSLIKDLKTEVVKAHLIIAEQGDNISTLTAVNTRLQNRVDEKDQTIDKLNKVYNELNIEARKKRWFQDPKIMVAVGLAAGVLIAKL